MGENTKDRILDTAFNLFLERTYDSVTLDQVAEKADVSKGAIFHYFDSKFKLASQSMFRYMKKEWIPMYRELDKTEDAEEVFKRSIEYSFDFFLDNPKFMQFFMDLYERSEREEMIEGELNKFYDGFLQAASDVFDDLGMEKPRLKAHILTASIDGLALQFTFLGEDELPPVKELKDEIYRLFMDGDNR